MIKILSLFLLLFSCGSIDASNEYEEISLVDSLSDARQQLKKGLDLNDTDTNKLNAIKEVFFTEFEGKENLLNMNLVFGTKSNKQNFSPLSYALSKNDAGKTLMLLMEAISLHGNKDFCRKMLHFAIITKNLVLVQKALEVIHDQDIKRAMLTEKNIIFKWESESLIGNLFGGNAVETSIPLEFARSKANDKADIISLLEKETNSFRPAVPSLVGGATAPDLISPPASSSSSLPSPSPALRPSSSSGPSSASGSSIAPSTSSSASSSPSSSSASNKVVKEEDPVFDDLSALISQTRLNLRQSAALSTSRDKQEDPSSFPSSNPASISSSSPRSALVPISSSSPDLISGPSPSSSPDLPLRQKPFSLSLRAALKPLSAFNRSNLDFAFDAIKDAFMLKGGKSIDENNFKDAVAEITKKCKLDRSY